MAKVQIIWSEENGGSDISEPINHDANSLGSISPEKEIYIRHTGDNDITDCKFYFRAYTSTTDGEDYVGNKDPDTDFAELVDWGDQTTTSGYGGLEVLLEDDPSYWPDESNKQQLNGSDVAGFVVSSGVADSLANAIDLGPNMAGITSSGVIPAGGSPGVYFKCRMHYPDDEDTPGIRQVEQVLSFSYTS